MMKSRGFTLVEVMVALAVVAIALPALLTVTLQQVDGMGYLRDKSIAQWVAGNKLAESRVQLARSNVLFKGTRSGVTTMAERDWYWWVQSTATEVEDFHRLEVRVAAAEDQQETPLYTLVGFVSAGGAEGALSLGQ